MNHRASMRTTGGRNGGFSPATVPPRRLLVALAACLLLLPALVLAGPAGACSGQPDVAATQGGQPYLEICAGNHQETAVGTPFEQALIVRLAATAGPTAGPGASTRGSVLPNVGIHFQVIPGSNGAGAHPAGIEINTDANGIASLLLTANDIPGPFTVRAQALGKGMSAANDEFSLANTGSGTPQPSATQAVPALSVPALLALALALALLLVRPLRR